MKKSKSSQLPTTFAVSKTPNWVGFCLYHEAFSNIHMAISLFCDRWRVMASIVVALALLLVFQSAKADDFNDLLSPLLSPIFGWFLTFFFLDFVAFTEMGWRCFFGFCFDLS